MTDAMCKLVSKQIGCGNWNGAVKILDSMDKTKENTSEYLNIIVKCCRSCVDKEANPDADKLFHTVKTCAGALGDLNMKDLSVYYRSIYYVIKYLHEQVSCLQHLLIRSKTKIFSNIYT